MLVPVVDDEPAVEALFRRQFRRERPWQPMSAATERPIGKLLPQAAVERR
jgi:hypothetical protein